METSKIVILTRLHEHLLVFSFQNTCIVTDKFTESLSSLKPDEGYAVQMEHNLPYLNKTMYNLSQTKNQLFSMCLENQSVSLWAGDFFYRHLEGSSLSSLCGIVSMVIRWSLSELKRNLLHFL